MDGEEHVPVVRIHMDLGLEHPGMDGNAAGCLLVIAQGELDEVAPTRPAGRRGVPVGIDAQGDIVLEHVVLGAARGEVG